MKNLLSILVVLALATTFSFAQVNDNLTTGKTGTGSFTATVLTPLTINSPTPINLGEFVASTSAYTIGQVIDFTITGDGGHAFVFTATATPSNTNVSYTGSWNNTTGAATLSGTPYTPGSYTLTYTLASILANTPGTSSLDLNVVVAYNF